MRATLITGPSVEPLTLAEAKDHLRVSWANEDALITRLIVGAREAFERETGRQLLTANWNGFLDRFPRFDREPIEIAKPPLLVVNAVTYLDTSGALQTWSASEYTVQSFSGPFAQRGMLFPKAEQQYPDTRWIPNAVTVDFDAGYGATAADVPDEIKEALLGWIGLHYENREFAITGTIATRLPGLGFDSWIDSDFG